MKSRKMALKSSDLYRLFAESGHWYLKLAANLRGEDDGDRAEKVARVLKALAMATATKDDKALNFFNTKALSYIKAGPHGRGEYGVIVNREIHASAPPRIIFDESEVFSLGDVRDEQKNWSVQTRFTVSRWLRQKFSPEKIAEGFIALCDNPWAPPLTVDCINQHKNLSDVFRRILKNSDEVSEALAEKIIIRGLTVLGMSAQKANGVFDWERKQLKRRAKSTRNR